MKDSEKSGESDEEVADDNAEGDYTSRLLFSGIDTCEMSLCNLFGFDMYSI